jgi:hypothetical protein
VKIVAMIFAIGSIVAGCAGEAFVGGGSGKYLQLRNPMNSQVILQTDYQSESACRYDLSTGNRQLQKENPEMLKYRSCNNISFSSSLPYRTVTKNKLLNTTFDNHFITLELCNNIIDEGGKDPNFEIVIPCHRKQ